MFVWGYNKFVQRWPFCPKTLWSHHKSTKAPEIADMPPRRWLSFSASGLVLSEHGARVNGCGFTCNRWPKVIAPQRKCITPDVVRCFYGTTADEAVEAGTARIGKPRSLRRCKANPR